MFSSTFKNHFMDFMNEKHSLGYNYKTCEKELSRFDSFLYLNNIKVINHEIISLYVNLFPNWSQNTKARNMGTINEFLKYLKKHGISEYIISPRSFKQLYGNYRPYIFSKDELHAIFSEADKYTSNKYLEVKYIVPVFYRLLYGTGIRIGEALNIKRSNVDLENGTIKLVNTKNGTERFIVLSDSLIRFLKDYVNKMTGNSEYLFYNYKFTKLNISTMENYFYKLLERAGIKRMDNSPRVHDLRFTFITHSFRKYCETGKDPYAFLPILETYVGHQSIKALEYYIKTTQVDQDNIRKLSEEKFSYIIPRGCDNDE